MGRGGEGIQGGCEVSEQQNNQQAEEPFYAIATGTGIAIRDAKHRCIGTLTFRPWMSESAKHAATFAIINAFRDGGCNE